MAIEDLFKSRKQRQQEEALAKAKAQRKAFRDAEHAVDLVKDRIAKLKKEREKAWVEAKQYLKDGQKAAAQRSLQTCRASEMLMSKLEMKRWVFEQLISKLELAKSDQDFSEALKAINTVINIDPDKVADVLDEVQDKLGDQIDTDKIWEKVYGKEMEGVQSEMTDAIPSIEEMESQLQDEVVAELGSPSKQSVTDESVAGSSVKAQIGEGRKRLKDLLDGTK